MKKGSFFERLTGAINEEETKENNSLEELEELEETKPEKVEVIEKKPKTKKSHSKATASIEDSNSEEEGELLIDVYQTSDEIIIKSAIAGVKADDLAKMKIFLLKIIIIKNFTGAHFLKQLFYQ